MRDKEDGIVYDEVNVETMGRIDLYSTITRARFEET